jgi:DNA-dependent RNA polymerase auxiliary subunit epsilon
MIKTYGLNNKTVYLLPRYSSLSVNGYRYSIANDLSFTPEQVDDDGFLNGISGQTLLYQGEVIEYKELTAQGNDYEIFYLNDGQNSNVDHYTIDVYVKSVSDGKWRKSTRTQSLYLNNSSDLAHECRLNENGYYEIRFGNNICGKKLELGDIVQIYYIKSNPSATPVSKDDIDNSFFVVYNTNRFMEILDDTTNKSFTRITNANSQFVQLHNESPSTVFEDAETVEQIRENAPAAYRAQYRLVTQSDYETFLKKNYRNIIQSAKVMNNWEYINSYLKFLYSIGLKRPSSDTRMALNQFHFADACNFNNVYIFAVPKITNLISGYSYISNDLKSKIIEDMQATKTLTTEPVVVDPFYMGFQIGINENGKQPSHEDGERSMLVIEKKTASVRSAVDIKSEVVKTFEDFFSVRENQIGEEVSIIKLSQKLQEIEGVSSLTTQRTNKDGTKTIIQGISFVVFNETYPEIGYCTASNFSMEPFMFPYYKDIRYISDHIKIEERLTTATIEY